MWYALVIFCMVFDLAVLGIAPFFANALVSGTALCNDNSCTILDVNTSSTAIANGTNPLDFLGAINSITVGDVAVFSIVFVVINAVGVICLVKLIRGS